MIKEVPRDGETGVVGPKTSQHSTSFSPSASVPPTPVRAAHLPSSRGNPLGGGDVHSAVARIASPAPWGSTSGRHWAHRVHSHRRPAARTLVAGQRHQRHAKAAGLPRTPRRPRSPPAPALPGSRPAVAPTPSRVSSRPSLQQEPLSPATRGRLPPPGICPPGRTAAPSPALITDNTQQATASSLLALLADGVR